MGKFYYDTLATKAHFLMKKEWFFFPLGLIFKTMGGIPIDRAKKGSVVKLVARLFQGRSPLHIAITPEGTRSANKQWKTGFYHIAKRARVPIELAKIDYHKKEVGIFEVFYPGDSLEEDLAYIRSKYSAQMACHPSQFIASS